MNHHAAFLSLSVLFMPAGAAGPGLPVLIGWAVAVLFLIAAIVAWLRGSKASARANEIERELARSASRLEEYDGLKDALEHERTASEKLRTDHAVIEARLQERERALAELRTRMENDFSAMASAMLNQTHETFLKRANETFERHQEATKADAEKRRQSIDEMVRPMKDSLVRYEEGLREMRDHNKKAQGALTSQIEVLARSAESIKGEASKLATALRSGSRTRGRWGEEQLRNVVEMTGLSSYVDFTEQLSLSEEGRAKQPDMVVSLPGERVIAVDSKVSLNAYLEAAEQTDDAQRTVYLAKHAEEIWTHVKGLASKNYAEALKKQGSLDFVVMFIPGENFYAAAMEHRPTLFQEAFDRGILIATPTSLIAILKSIAYGWRQEKAAENAHKVADMAKDLYAAMCKMGTNLQALGKSLETSVKRYNDTIGNIEGRVMPKARRFAEFEMPGTEKDVPEVEPVEADVREISAGRDLFLDPPLDEDKDDERKTG